MANNTYEISKMMQLYRGHGTDHYIRNVQEGKEELQKGE